MFRPTSFLAALLLLSLSAAQLRAGGPPWLSLPLDGVTAENADQCAELLTKKLKDKVWSQSHKNFGVMVRQHAKQWFLTFDMEQNVGLHEVEAALKGTKFSVPRDKLRLFGHVVLEIEPGQAAAKALTDDLNKLPYVSVENTKEEKDQLLITIDMPYPVETTAADRDERKFAWDAFARNDFSSDQSKRVEPHATPKTLPTYDSLYKTVARHDAKLKTIHWNPNYACRPLGAAAE